MTVAPSAGRGKRPRKSPPPKGRSNYGRFKKEQSDIIPQQKSIMIITWFVGACLAVVAIRLLCCYSSSEPVIKIEPAPESIRKAALAPRKSPETFQVEVEELQAVAEWIAFSVRSYRRGISSHRQLLATADNLSVRLSAIAQTRSSASPTKPSSDSTAGVA